MKKPASKLSLPSTPVSVDSSGAPSESATVSKMDTPALSAEQVACYSSVTAANGFSMEAALQRLEDRKSKRSS